MIKLEDYRDPWLGEKVNDFIGFYNREFFCLDNFSSFGFMYEGIYYQTVEHAYQSLRFRGSSKDVEQQIINAFSAYDAQRIAHENITLQIKNWDDIKLSLMEKLLRAKLAAHPYVQKKLLKTENYLICEDSPKDAFWGIGPNRDGRNELGKLWMKLRQELQDQTN